MIDISIAQLQHFVALADTGSFTKAAERSRRSQAAFSRSIATLESQVRAPLVDRIGHRNELTPFGRIVLQHARNVIADVEMLARTSEEYAQGTGGHFRIGLGSTPNAMLSVPLLTYVSRHKSNLRITISSGAPERQIAALRDRQIDALIVETRAVLPRPDLLVEHLVELRNGLLCRPDHPLMRHAEVPFEALLDYPVASTAVSAEATRFLLDRFGPDAHPERLVTLQCDDVRSLLDVVEASDAVFMGVVAAGRDRVRAGRLVAIATSGIPLSSVFSIITVRGRAEPLSFPTIRDIVRESLSDADLPPGGTIS